MLKDLSFNKWTPDQVMLIDLHLLHPINRSYVHLRAWIRRRLAFSLVGEEAPAQGKGQWQIVTDVLLSKTTIHRITGDPEVICEQVNPAELQKTTKKRSIMTNGMVTVL